MKFSNNFISCSVLLLATILVKGVQGDADCPGLTLCADAGFCDAKVPAAAGYDYAAQFGGTCDPYGITPGWCGCPYPDHITCWATECPTPAPTPAPPPPPCPPPTPATTLTPMYSGAGLLGVNYQEGDPWCPCLRVAEELQKETPELTPKITCTIDTFLIVDGAEGNCLSVAEELDKGTPELTPKITCYYLEAYNYTYLMGSSDVACALNCLVGITGGTFEKVADGALISEECPACTTPADISSLAANGHGSGDHPHEEADHPHAHTHWWLIVLIIILFLVVVVLIVRQVRLQYSAEP